MSRVEKRTWIRQGKEQHSYYLDGEQKLDGVTTILGAMDKGEALLFWSGKVNGRDAYARHDELAMMTDEQRDLELGKAHLKLRNDAARDGTQFHGFAQRLALGEAVPVEEIRDADLGLLRMLRWATDFLDAWKFQPIVTETVCWSAQHRYAGTFDLVAWSPLFPGRTFLMDWKTGTGVYREAALQLAAYAGADFYVNAAGNDVPMPGLEITDHLVLHVDKALDRIVPIQLATGPEVFDYFLSVQSVYQCRPLDKTLIKGELPLPNLAVIP
jgi:hypothetical protein